MSVESRTSPTPTVIRIPAEIRKQIEDRGFHLYKWISPEEVKLSIERDFLGALKKIGIPLAIISILVAFISGWNLWYFFLTIIFGVGGVFFYLLWLSLQRSKLLSKSAFVIMTDSSISLGGKIHKLSDISGLQNDIEQVSETFQEELFGESGLEQSKNSLTDDVIEQLFGGYKAIFSMSDGRIGRSKDSAQGMLLIIALYTLYVILMASVYFVGVLFLLVLGKFFVWVNTRYLLRKGVTVIKINDLFGKLDQSSEQIHMEKKSLKHLLTEAYNNDWKDGLLLKIGAGIDDINTSTEQAIDYFGELRNTIDSSVYKDMFSYPVYQGWIKKQIISPLSQILKLLQKNEAILQETQQEITQQIKNTKKVELQSALKLQLKRIKMQKKDIQRFIPILESSLEKLQ